MSGLPAVLVNQVREGHVVLVLGAGASLGATRPDGRPLPRTDELSQLIAERFLDGQTHGSDLAWTAELAISATSLDAVQDFIADQFSDPTPTEHQMLVPTFRWRGIATTNYDRVVERSFELSSAPIQHAVPFLANDDRVDSKLRDPSYVGLLKLHGCVTRTHDASLPLILTADQYVTHRKNRDRVFQMLEEWATENTLVFVGQSLRDTDLRKLLIDLVSRLGGHPRFYIVRPDVDDQERDLWAAKNISVVKLSYSDLMRQLDVAIPRAQRPLLKRLNQDHPIRKHFVTTTPLSRALRESLEYDWEYVHAGMAIQSGTARQFYSGFGLGWYPIQAQLDVRRSLGQRLIEDVFLRPEQDRPSPVELYLVKGEAGSGKSVLLRRVAWNAATDGGAIVLYAKQGRLPQFGALRELAASVGERLFVFVESPSGDPGSLAELLGDARRAGLRLTVVVAERTNEWNIRCEALELFVTAVHSVHNLSEPEIGHLVDLLELHHALGERLAGLSRAQRIDEFVKQAERQLLVALHVATLGKPFEEILLDEYARIVPAAAQRLYLSVCVLNRLKVPVRAGVISRAHGIPFEEFREKLFRPLEHVVHADPTPSGDMVYRARHSEIAQIVFQRILTEPSDRYNEIVRMIRVLNPVYATDLTAIRSLMRARSVLALFPSHDDAIALYRVATEVMGEEDVYLLQQRANYERLRPNGNLGIASALLSKARELDPKDESVIHTLAEVMIKRANDASNLLERRRYRAEAEALLNAMRNDNASGRLAINSRARIAIDGLKDTLASEAAEQDVDSAVRSAEKLIEVARQRSPGDAYVDGLEVELSQALADYGRAFDVLAKAQRVNPRDPFIATRYATMLLARGSTDAARSVVAEALSSASSDKRLNYMFAEIERTQSQSPPMEELVHYYRRAFTRWDSNYESQFWFARFAWQIGREALTREAKEVFAHLRSAPVPHAERMRIRDVSRTGGAPTDTLATIKRVEATYAFAAIDGSQEWVFIHHSDVSDFVWAQLAVDVRIRCHIGFALGGPRAVEVHLEGRSDG